MFFMTLYFANKRMKTFEDDIAEGLVYKLGEYDSFYKDGIIRVSFENLSKQQIKRIESLKDVNVDRLKAFLSNILYRSVYFITRDYYEFPIVGREKNHSFRFFIPYNSYSDVMYTSFGGPFHYSISERYYQPLIFPFEKYCVVGVLELKKNVPEEIFLNGNHFIGFSFEHFEKNFPKLITKYHMKGIFPFISLPNLKSFPKKYLKLTILGYLSSTIKDKIIIKYSADDLPPYIEYSYSLREIPKQDLEEIIRLEETKKKATTIIYSF